MSSEPPHDATSEGVTDGSPYAVPGRVRIPSSRALAISRLDAILDQAWEHRLTLVIAPAGAGKSTLLARFAAAAPGPVAWYRADGWDRDPVRMLRHLDQALRAAVPGIRGGWETVEDALDRARAGPARPDAAGHR